MINLRYHIVSLTAVFLAMGIGLTLGSTFLDRATVDNLQGRLDNLQGRLDEREQEINDLQEQLDSHETTRTALDEQAIGLLDGLLADVPVAVVASRGVDEEDVRASVQALEVAGADLQGLLWLTDRWALGASGEVDDLRRQIEEETDDPSRLRRVAINLLGDELRDRQLLGQEDEDEEAPGSDDDQPPAAPPAGSGDDGADPSPSDETTDQPAGGATTTAPVAGEDRTSGPAADDPPSTLAEPGIDVLTGLIEIGFVDFEAVPDGPELPAVPPGTRYLLIGGSGEVPDDLVIEPLVSRMAASAVSPLRAVAGSARAEDGEVSDLVAVIRESDELRELVSTVDDLEHFDSWAAMVLAMRDAGDGVIGHYGVAEGASRLLPPFPTT